MAGWLRPPRLPLGDHWAGACHARTDDVVEPLELQQREVCNCGYAKGRCDRFPGGDSADAVRFSVLEDTGGMVRLVYILEKDHAPAGHGTLEFAMPAAHSGSGGLLDQQARAFLESYRRTRALAASV
jgi:hypothetical protein